MGRQWVELATMTVLLVSTPIVLSFPGTALAQIQTTPRTNPQTSHPDLQAAANAFQAGNLDLALHHYQRALKDFRQQKDTPSIAQTLWNIGQVYHQQEKYQAAITVLQEARQLLPKGTNSLQGITASLRIAYSGFGSQLQQQRQFDRATTAYQTALELAQSISDPDGQGLSLLALANLWREQQQFRQAIPLLKQALTVLPDKSDLRSIVLITVGRTYDDLSETALAIDTYQQALTLAQQMGDRQQIAAILNNLGTLQNRQGNHTQAIARYLQGLQTAQEMQTRYGEAITSRNLARSCEAAKVGENSSLYRFMRQFCGVQQLPETVLLESFNKLRLQLVNQGKVLESRSLNNLGNSHVRLGDYQTARGLFERSLLIDRDLGDKSNEGTSLNNLANLYTNLGQYQQALTLYQQSLQLHQTLNNRSQIAITLNNIGQVYDRQGDYDKALAVYQQARYLSQTLNDLDNEATVLNNIGSTQQTLGDYPNARQQYDHALMLYEVSGNRPGKAVTLANLAVFYATLGDYAKALDFHQRALLIAQEIGEKNLQAINLDNIGRLYDDQAQYAKGLTYHQRAFDIHRSIGNRPAELGTLVSFGLAYRTLGRYAKAQEFYDRALQMAREMGSPIHEAVALSGLGSLYLEAGQLSQAEKTLQQALALHRKLGSRRTEIGTLKQLGRVYAQQNRPPEALQTLQAGLILAKQLKLQPEETELLTELGKVSLDRRDFNPAEQYLKSAIALAQKLGNNGTAGKALTLLGAVQIQKQQSATAIPLLTQAAQLWESQRPGLIDFDRVSLFETQKLTYELLQQALILQQKPEAALEVAERGRARAFVELLASRLGPQNQQILGSVPKLQDMRQLAQIHKATLVQYSVIANQEVYIWVIKPDGTVRFYRNSATEPIVTLIQDSRDELGIRGRAKITITQQPNPSTRSLVNNLRHLHNLLIAPISQDLPSNPEDLVIFVPQGALFLVPFAALEDGQGDPLITRHTIATVPSLQAIGLTTPNSRSTNLTAPLIVGNPKMPTYNNEPLASLPGAEQEATQIAQVLQGSALIGNQATKNTVVQRMQTASIIHLATHGLLDTLRGEVPGAIALTPSAGNDGFLTAGEILDLKLKADLAVLSACSTGRGDITGDGVIGLSRSLFIAGVPSVVVSLWNVKDESTAFLMTEFYRRLKVDPSQKAQALRQAMLATREKYSHPSDWAAFNLIGNAN
ncbi:tetratricopeptide repeat protein [Alkalinema pantanalense CENA528]|uniref:CHAT domain-containing tetratricopeptide repeat protein n=1 Tax=Alkalinema pantanalense TaxID=1620705 RepID=UPI003D6EB356